MNEMKFPTETNENASNLNKTNQKGSSGNVDAKLAEDVKDGTVLGGKTDGKNSSGCAIEPNTTALIPPWLRNSLGLNEKGMKQNHKCFKTAVNNYATEVGEKLEVYDNCSNENNILEVNIGHEADFIGDNYEERKSSQTWKSRSGKRSQFEYNIFCHDKRLARSVKSDVTSIDVVVPMDDQDEEYCKTMNRRMKSKSGKLRSFTQKAEESHNGIVKDSPCTLIYNNMEHEIADVDSRFLLLCGKDTVDSLTQDDVSLLQEMKNQICHKEGLAKLFTEIKETNNTVKEKSEDKLLDDRDGGLWDAGKSYDTSFIFAKDTKKCDVKEIMRSDQVNKNGKTLDDGKKCLDEVKKHYDKKKLYQQKLAKYSKEYGKLEKSKITHKDRDDKGKKSKIRHNTESSLVEKAVNETLEKFIETYRCQVPSDVICNMKRNIMEKLQTDYPESAALNDKLIDSVLTEERVDSKTSLDRKASKNVENENPSSTGEEKVSIHDEEETKKETRNTNLRILQKDFDDCLKSISSKVDITGSKLCGVVFEKIEEDNPGKVIRIVYDASQPDESIKIFNEQSAFGSPEGDSLFTSILCDCQRSTRDRKDGVIKRHQASQTKDKKRVRRWTQTYSADEDKSTELTPGLYRIIKAQSEIGRFYLCPEEIDECPESMAIIESKDSKIHENEDLGFLNVDQASSRDTFLSEKLPKSNRPLYREFNSDCLGLNICELSRKDAKRTILKIVAMNDKIKFDGEIKTEKKENGEQQKDCVTDNCNRLGVGDQEGQNESQDGFHMGCVWLWNGKKISPGVDLKDHVENLLREKLREIFSEFRCEEPGYNRVMREDGSQTLDQTDAILTDENTPETNDQRPEQESIPDPFIFSGLVSENQREIYGKSVREVGTQKSLQTIISHNRNKMKSRPRLIQACRKQRIKKQKDKMKTVKPLSYAENVGEAKKVKLEFRDSGAVSRTSKDCNIENVRECYSLVSNSSSASNKGPVRVKLIGIEVLRERKSVDGESSGNLCKAGSESRRVSAEEFSFKDCVDSASRDLSKQYKHWKLIEKMLNKVNQKEKDGLWNDIRDFIKKKIGRDINDEDAREVCIEIEQDVPKCPKAKSRHEVVAKGSYMKTEGDVEVEVDLTLDDLEQIVRHRRKSLRRQNYRRMKMSHKTSSSSMGITSEDISESSLSCRNCNTSTFSSYITNSELNMISRGN